MLFYIINLFPFGFWSFPLTEEVQNIMTEGIHRVRSPHKNIKTQKIKLFKMSKLVGVMQIL